MTSLFGLANLEFPKGKWEFVENWFLMGSPIPLLTIWASYLLFVLKVGPAIMKNRKPFQLKKTLLVYNAFQVVYSMYIVIEAIPMIKQYGFLRRECLLYKEDTLHGLMRLAYIYHIGKMSELLDTIFFVLRKKNEQVTFLHVYHHSLMYVITWLYMKHIATDQGLFVGSINSSVHIIMYSYYGLSALGPNITKYLTWKKYITKIQLTQFAMVLVHFIMNGFISDCPLSTLHGYIFVQNVFLFIYMFYQFYVKSYKNMNSKTEEKAQKKSLNENTKQCITKENLNAIDSKGLKKL